ncbi:MAG: hypothetical protein B0W54_05865 [Cellvibrio sp. 79]|nr:MAG: hypothetical protein B0W54_05865 [Cellvibrio sp. 79]
MIRIDSRKPYATSPFFYSVNSLRFINHLLHPFAHGNGLDDVKQALARYQQSAPFSAKVNASIKNLNKEDDDQKTADGAAYFFIEQSPSGLAIRYAPELLASIDKETRAKKQNSQAPTPTILAMNRFNYTEFTILLNPVRDIEDDLHKANFIKEEATTYEGKAARLLHFEIPLEKLGEEERKNLKKYETEYQLWIDEQGTPLASHAKGKGSGRVALVIGFEFHFDVQKTYIKSGERLLVNKLTSTSGSSGAGMNNNEDIKATLTLLN